MMNTKRNLILVTLAVSYLLYTYIDLFHSRMWDPLLAGSFGVLEGTPHWRAQQNRVLGPLILKSISSFGFSQLISFKIYIFFFTFINNLLFIFVLNKVSNTKQIYLKSLLVFNLLILISQDRWIFAWDFLEITFFIIYCYLLFDLKKIRYLPIVNFFHIFNRESFMIMALFFLVLNFYINKKYKLEIISTKNKFLLYFNLVFGVLFIYFSRLILFKHQSEFLGSGLDETNKFLGGTWITPIYNFKTFLEGDLIINLVILSTIFFTTIYLFIKFKQGNLLEKILTLATIINIVPIFFFGIFTETRQYQPSLVILSFLIFLEIYGNKINFLNNLEENF